MTKIVKLISTSIILSSILLLSCFLSLLLPSQSAAKPRPQPSFDNNAWVASWDYPAGLKEAQSISSQLNSVSYFGGALDKNGRVIVTGPAKDFAAAPLPRYRLEVARYLSVVNDVYENINDPNGKTTLKDTAILEDLLATPESRQKHIDDLFQTMKNYGYTGLEIDYERIWRNPLAAYRYVKFIQELASAAEKESIPLRIILEPSVPANKLVFPEGPEYVVMCYNLYGTHTKDAGPKADKGFIDTVLSRMDRLPRPHSIAFATGGCVWESGKKPRFVDEKEARSLQDSLHAAAARDAASGAVTFSGQKDGRTITCWYADAETLQQWKEQALKHGTDGISLWRLGGNHQITEYYPGIVNNQER